MEVPDVSLSPDFEWALLTALFNPVAFLLSSTAASAADFTLFFTVVLAGLATAFVVADAGLDGAATVFALLAAVFSDGAVAGVAAVLAFVAAFFVVDLVTVAFIVSPFY